MEQLIKFHTDEYTKYAKEIGTMLLDAEDENDLDGAKDWVIALINSMKPGSCPSCGGIGYRAYGDTSTWHSGAGGQQITGGICDKCWGSGNIQHPGINLRRCMGYLKMQVSEDADSKHARIYWGHSSLGHNGWVVEYKHGDTVTDIKPISSRKHGIAHAKASDAAWVDIYMPHGTYERILIYNNIKQMR